MMPPPLNLIKYEAPLNTTVPGMCLGVYYANEVTASGCFNMFEYSASGLGKLHFQFPSHPLENKGVIP